MANLQWWTTDAEVESACASSAGLLALSSSRRSRTESRRTRPRHLRDHDADACLQGQTGKIIPRVLGDGLTSQLRLPLVRAHDRVLVFHRPIKRTPRCSWSCCPSSSVPQTAQRRRSTARTCCCFSAQQQLMARRRPSKGSGPTRPTEGERKGRYPAGRWVSVSQGPRPRPRPRPGERSGEGEGPQGDRRDRDRDRESRRDREGYRGTAAEGGLTDNGCWLERQGGIRKTST